RDEWVQAPGHAGGRARAQARAGEGRRADDEARDRGVVPGKQRLRGGVAEVEALRRAVSPGTHQRYTVTLICEALNAPRASVYAAAVVVAPADGGKRGRRPRLPTTPWSWRFAPSSRPVRSTARGIGRCTRGCGRR